uniref:hypothetical protein n=1 Tax=Nitrospira cf. moscoviensis SBR1015 TaxID=96242 RepID=UPI000B3BCCD9|nr:hypothetical protein [Nitrospira cf. moscoviensis SBR1015]
MTETATYEHHFITNDGPIFNMIEDERGEIFWGYGHREADEFRSEVNRWLAHMECGENCIDGGYPVDHLWARMDDENGEHFKLVDKPWLGTKEAADDAFPVTRLCI